MTLLAIPAVFMRGGTSKAIMFHARDLPAERARWDPIFLAALGSPDPHGRQLEALRADAGEGALRIGMPSGVLTVAADVARDAASGLGGTQRLVLPHRAPAVRRPRTCVARRCRWNRRHRAASHGSCLTGRSC